MTYVVILDYDNTYTQDPALWLKFIRQIKEEGHAILCCTMRYGHELDPMCKLLRKEVKVVHTSRMAKRQFLISQHYDLTHAVWIDGSPHWIFEAAT